MDPALVKGHFFLGQSLLEGDNYDEATKHLQRGIMKLISKKTLKYIRINVTKNILIFEQFISWLKFQENFL